MKKMVRLAVLVLTLCLVMSAVALAEKVTSNGVGYENIPFSNGYNGYCIDRSAGGAYEGDSFSVMDTSAAKSNTTNQDISASLKALFTQCFEEMFEKQAGGDYKMKNANVVLGAVYHFSEDQYVWGDQKKLTDKTKAYQGPAIPDHGYQLTLSNGDVATFDFVVLVPDKADQQYFFAYKFKVSEGHTCGDGEQVPGKTAKCDEAGWKAYYSCSCGKNYADQACTEEITDLAAWKVGAGKTTADHVYGDYVNTDADKHWKECDCGDKTAEGEHDYDNNKDADCNICGYKRTIAHEHEFATTLSYDEENHWYAATCGHDVKAGEEAHHGGTATCTEQAKCEDCGQPYGKKADHVYGDYVNTDADKHWKECDCGDKTAEGGHDYDNNKDADCNTCGYKRTIAHEHEFATTLSYDKENHWYAATCGHDVKSGEEAHHGGTATCTEQAKCEECGQPYGKKADHEYGDYVNTDADKHWKECDCGDKTAEGGHDYDNNKDADCNTCGYKRTIAHEHEFATTLSYDEENHWYAATCGHDVKSGEEAHHGGTATCTEQAKCEDCGQPYGKKADHVYGDYVNTDADKHWKECDCGDKTAEGGHDYDNNKDADCNICGYKRTIAPETFTVAFFANGGTGTMPSKNVNAGTVVSVPENAFVRTGYTFTGWNTTADGSGKAYSAGMTVVVNQNVTLYAQWKSAAVEKQMKIDKHPDNQYVVDGQRAEFAVQASGDGLRYQWFIDRNNGKGWREIEGAKNAKYTTSVTDTECNGFRYYCRVTDENGNTLNSDVAVLHVTKAPVLPETGDHSTPALWMMLGIVSLLGMVILRRKAFVK